MNGKKVGGNANISKFTAYVSPYFVVSNGGAYTKHIYAANQRIASKLGNVDGFGADPRRVEMAGGKKISDIQKDNIGARFSELGFAYTAPEKEKVEKDSTMDSEAEEKLIFFYHPDHLGSTSYVTDADGNIAQHNEYIPYGEVFVEERNNSFSTNYLFNAKELDNETGLYYYGARYLDPTGAMWLSVDPMWEKYAGMSPYSVCGNNPIVIKDEEGEWLNFVVGALAGAATDYVFQVACNVAENGLSSDCFTNVDEKSILMSGLAGATGVGVGSIASKAIKITKLAEKTSKTAKIAKTAINTGGDMISSALGQVEQGKEVSFESCVEDAIGGAVGRKVSGIIQNKRVYQQKILDKDARRAQRIAGSSGRPTRQQKADVANRDAKKYKEKTENLNVFSAVTSSNLISKSINKVRDESKKTSE